MGFDIEAQDVKGNGVAYLGTYMGAFRMMKEQGYDWFELIDAYDCYGGVSGNGEDKFISKQNLEKAMTILKDFKVEKMSSEGRDEITGRREVLMEFMQDCVDWCNKNNTNRINIYFG